MTTEQGTQDNTGFTLVGKGPAYHKQICSMLLLSRMFSDLEWLEIENLAPYFQCFKGAAGAVLFREGSKGSFLCLLHDGSVEVSRRDSDERKRVLDHVGPGNTLGEMAIIDGEPRSATAVVLEPSTLVLLNREEFNRLMKEKPLLGAKVVMRIARLLSERLRKAGGTIATLMERGTN